MKVQNLSLNGLKLLTPVIHQDERGYFFESYRKELFAFFGIAEEFVQDNHSFSNKGVLRGMHFQSSPGQAKLVRVIEGEIYDVVVDIRTASPTFGKWEAIKLDSKDHSLLYIPAGFAHGFSHS